MLVGAGTVLTTQQVDEAIEVGAEFIVSPGLNTEIVTYCKKCNIPDFPGCSNASDLEQAISCGLSVVKFFPAEVSGGIKAIKALSAPYHRITSYNVCYTKLLRVVLEQAWKYLKQQQKIVWL